MNRTETSRTWKWLNLFATQERKVPIPIFELGISVVKVTVLNQLEQSELITTCAIASLAKIKIVQHTLEFSRRFIAISNYGTIATSSRFDYFSTARINPALTKF